MGGKQKKSNKVDEIQGAAFQRRDLLKIAYTHDLPIEDASIDEV